MIPLTERFIQDISTRNTSIIPLVEIITGDQQDLCFSTISTTYNGKYYKPILLDISPIKKSVNLKTKDFKISNATIRLSNYEHDGARVSQVFQNTSLINAKITISWKSQSDEVVLIYDALIRDIKQTSKEIIINAEDLGESMLHKDLPIEDLGVEPEIPDDYKGKKLPMVYGHVDNSPTVIGVTSTSNNEGERSQRIFADYKPLAKFNENQYLLGAHTFYDSALSIDDGSGGFVPIKQDDSKYVIEGENTVRLDWSGNLVAQFIRKIIGSSPKHRKENSWYDIFEDFVFSTTDNQWYVFKAFVGDDVDSPITRSTLEQNGNFVQRNIMDVTDSIAPYTPTDPSKGFIIYGQIDSEGTDGAWFDINLEPANHDFDCKTYLIGDITNNAPVEINGLDRANWRAWVGEMPRIEGNDLDDAENNNLRNLSSGNLEEYRIDNFDTIGSYNSVKIGIPDHRSTLADWMPLVNPKYDIDLRIRNIFIWQEASIYELLAKKYFLNLKGRYSSLHSGVTIPEPTEDNGFWTFNLGICSGQTVVESPPERFIVEHITGGSSDELYPADGNNMSRWRVPVLEQYIAQQEWFYIPQGNEMPWIGVLKSYTLEAIQPHDELSDQFIGYCFLNFYTSESAINWANENINIPIGSDGTLTPYDFPGTLTLVNKIQVWFLSANPEGDSDPNIPYGLLEYPMNPDDNGNPSLTPLSIWEQYGTIYNDINITTYNELALIKKPSDVIYHIADTELRSENQEPLPVNSTALFFARQEHKNWCMSHTVSDKINSKKYFKALANSSKLVPIIDSQGLSFVTLPINPYKSLLDGLINITTIPVNDIISYSFSRTSIEDIYTKVQLNWKKNYSSNSYVGDFSEQGKNNEISTDSDVYFHSEYNAGYYGLNADHSDSTLIIDSDFIRDFTTAQEYRKYLLYYHCNAKLEIDLELPIKYMAFEVGDFINFNGEITDNKSLPYGISLMINSVINGQQAFPGFVITSVDINLKRVKLRLQQLHNLSESPLVSTGSALGCTDPTAINYNPNALWNDGSCVYQEIYDNNISLFVQDTYELGNTIDLSMAFNLYDNDGIIIPISELTGYMYITIIKLDNEGNVLEYVYMDSSLSPQNYLSIDTDIDNFTQHFSDSISSLPFKIKLIAYHPISGDTYEVVKNFYINNPGYITPIPGCTDPNADNYDQDATVDDGSCEYTGSTIPGCTDPNANNYNPDATDDDGSCTYGEIPGCTDPDANNYNPNATEDDGSCIYVTPGDVTADGIINVLDIVSIANHVLLTTPLEPGTNAFLAADLNGDGIVNVLDLIEVVNIILS